MNEIKSYKHALFWMLLAAATAFLASVLLVIKFFAGGTLDPKQWTTEQWLYVIIAVGITAAITAAQAIIYQQGKKTRVMLVGIVLFAFFGVFTELSNSMERGEEVISYRSQNSAVFKQSLNAISNTSVNIPPSLTQSIADQSQIVARCEARLAEGKEPHCDGDKARLAALEGQVQTIVNAQSGTAVAMIDKARALEHDETKHYAVIKLFAAWFGMSALAASFWFSLVIVGVFEYAFYYLGTVVADKRRALERVSARVDTPDYASNHARAERADTPDTHVKWATNSGVDNAIKALWEAIEKGEVKSISVRDEGQPAQVLKKAGIGISNGERRAILDTALDALEKEGVLEISPQYDPSNPSNGKQKYVIAKNPPLTMQVA